MALPTGSIKGTQTHRVKTNRIERCKAKKVSKMRITHATSIDMSKLLGVIAAMQFA